MRISTKILTEEGLTKVSIQPTHSSGHKTRLYFFSDRTPEGVAKIQLIFELEIKGKNYEGVISQIFQEIQIKPYLLKTGNIFKLISEEEALKLQGPLSDPQKKDMYVNHWNKVLFPLMELVRDKKYYDKNFYFHLNRIKSFLDNEPFRMALNDSQKNTIIFILEQLFNEIIAFRNARFCFHTLEYRPLVDNNFDAQRSLELLRYIYDSLGEHYKVIECHKKELEIAQELKDHIKERYTYCGLGSAYYALDQYQESIESHKHALSMAQKLKDRKQEGIAYCNLGIAYHALRNYQKSIESHKNALKIAKELKDQVRKGSAHYNLGMAYNDLGYYHQAVWHYEECLKSIQKPDDQKGKVYDHLGNAFHNLGNYHKALEYHNEHLKIAQALKDQAGEKSAYGNLGNSYRGIGEYEKAMECHKTALTIAQAIQDKVGEGVAYSNLGNIYDALGKYYTALEYYKKDLAIAQKLGDSAGIGQTYYSMGNAHDNLGEHDKAIEYYEESLKIFRKIGDYVTEGKAYGNLGTAYNALGNYLKAVEYHEKDLKIAQEFGNRAGEGIAYGNLGTAHCSLGECHKALECHEKDLAIAQELKNPVEEGRAYSGLGNIYHVLQEYGKSLDYYEKALRIAQKLKSRVEEGIAYANLGNVYHILSKCLKAERCFNQGIKIAASIQHDAKESQWQVTVFERWSPSYIGLEKVLLSQNKNMEALEISDRRRSRVLSSLLSKKLKLKENQDFYHDPLFFQKVQKLAEKLHTVFITYSLLSINKEKTVIQAWIISSKESSLESILLPTPEDILLWPDKVFKTYPYITKIKRPKRGEKQVDEIFIEKLTSWYELLIAPLESHLPSPDSGETLTFIPDGFLAHLPFGAFYNVKQDKYLIEKYPISIAPSLQVLSLLDQLPKVFSNQILLMGNPTTPIEKNNDLKYSELEVREVIAPLMNLSDNEVLTQKEATVENVFKRAPHAKYIHFACHGIAEQKPLDDPHSVFEGYFQLAPDTKHPSGYLHAKEVNSLALKADLIFMSACHLGRGNLQKEGSIGPIWSFLGAGARSTIACYWPLPDSEKSADSKPLIKDSMTVQMVKTFYEHYLGKDTPKLNKAKALQQAVLMAMKTKRNQPRQWGAFFLSGLIE